MKRNDLMTPEELKKARNDLELTQPAFAKKLGVSERYYLYRESGVRKIPLMMKYAVKWLTHITLKK